MKSIIAKIILSTLVYCSFGLFSNTITNTSIPLLHETVFAAPTLLQNDLKANLTMSSEVETTWSDIEWKNADSFLRIITSYALMASMFIAVTMFIYGSYQLFTSEWDPKKHSEAIKGMIYAGIAFLIISFSYTLVEVASRFQI